MSRFFVACELGEERGRVMLGALHKDQLTLSEIHSFLNLPIEDRGTVLWDIDHLYQDILIGLRQVGAHDEPVESISCTSWPADYLLFHADASYIPPTFHHGDPRTSSVLKDISRKVPWESIYDETGVWNATNSTFFQLAAEKPRRLKRADHLMPVADGFNFLLSGAPCIELSSASTTQLFNSTTRGWSELLANVLRLPTKLLPPVVPAGTKLKRLRPEIAAATKLEDVQIIASCSNQLAASIVGLPAPDEEQWAFLRLGQKAVFGTELPEPLCSEASRALRFSNTFGYGGAVLFHKHTAGLRILEACRRFWAGADSGLDDGMLAHLAASAEPLEAFINLDDPRFASPADMPLKVRAYCKETGQPEPRKPGPIVRCVLESLALHYRKTLDELALLTGRDFTRLYLLGDSSNSLLTHFIANALQLPMVIVSSDAAVIGNLIVQAIAMGHIKTLDQARQIVRQSFKTETITPHAAAWTSAYERFVDLITVRAEATVG